MTSLLATTLLATTTPITVSNNNRAICSRRKKDLKKKQRIVKTEKPALPVSLPENRDAVTDKQPNKKMRKSNSKENLLNHVDDHDNAYLDAQEAKMMEYYENLEHMDLSVKTREHSKMSDIFWMLDNEYEKFQMTNMELSSPPLDTRMTLSEYEAYLLKEKDYWELWKSHGLSRKQYEDHNAYEKNRKTLMTLAPEDPEYDILQNKIRAFEDEMDAHEKAEDAKMTEWFLNFEANNPQLMERILKSCETDI
jgi:hypothetical protein